MQQTQKNRTNRRHGVSP